MQSQVERKQKDEQARATVNHLLEETGERERLKDLLKSRLVECGWRDELKSYCKDVIRGKGLEKITVDDLVSEITPRGKATIPDAIKAEMLERIRKFVEAHQNPVSKMPEPAAKSTEATQQK